MFFGLLSSSLLLFPQRFARYVLRTSAGVCRTRNLHVTSNYVLYWNHGVACYDSVYHNRVQGLSIPEDWTCNLQMIVFLKLRELTPITVTPCVLLDNSEWIFGYYKLNVLTLARITTIIYDFFTCAHIQISDFFFFRNSKFREGSRVRQTPEEGQRTYWPKRCGNNNKDEDNCPKNLNNKNQQASSQKFRQQIKHVVFAVNVLDFRKNE